MGGMRALGRRGAIGVTTVALAFAAAGTSVAAVRATSYQGGVLPSGLALRAPRSAAQPTLPPTSDDVFVPDAEVSGSASGASPGSPPAAAGTTPAPSTEAGAATAPASGAAPGAAATAGAPVGATAGRQVRPTLSTLPPASGPTPTTSPVRPVTTTCPSYAQRGALPVRGGPLKAVDFTLRWPLSAPLVLSPQASASRPSAALVTIASASAPMAFDGSSLSLVTPLGVTYTLASEDVTSQGTIRFTSVGGADVILPRQGCRDVSTVIYDVDRASFHGSALRIVGMVAPPGTTVTVSPDGGSASFRSSVAGSHRVTLLTANDAGLAGEIVSLVVNVG